MGRTSEDISRGKLASGLLGVGLAAGLSAASLGGVPTANATCIGFSGINIGTPGQCQTRLGTIAAVLGPGTATATGFFTGAIAIGDSDAVADGLATAAWASGTGTTASTRGIANWAIANGDGNVSAEAGLRARDWANIAVNFGSTDEWGTSKVQAGNGAVNLAGNLFGDSDTAVPGTVSSLTVRAGGEDRLGGDRGFGTVAANVIGNRNRVEAIGTFVNATNWGNFFTYPNGSGNTVIAGTDMSPARLSWAFNYQGIFTEGCSTEPCSNTVEAGPDRFSVAGAIGVIRRNVTENGGISIATRFNDTGLPPANVLAARATQRNLSRPSLNFTPGRNSTSNLSSTSSGGPIVKSIKQLTASAKKFNDQLAASAKKFNDQLAAPAKKRSNSVNATGGDK